MCIDILISIKSMTALKSLPKISFSYLMLADNR